MNDKFSDVDVLDDVDGLSIIDNIIINENKYKEYLNNKLNNIEKYDINNIKIGSVFSGIGSFEQALKNLNIQHTIEFACDNGGYELEQIANDDLLNLIQSTIDVNEKLTLVEKIYKDSKKKNYVRESYLNNYDISDNNFYSDIRFIGSHINKEIDIFVGGSPCQSFSIAGQRKGFEDTRGTLFFDFARCIKEFQPKVFIYENVKNIINHDKKNTLKVILETFDELGYKYYYKILNSKDYNIPQNRQRFFVIGFKDNSIDFSFPKPKTLEYEMSDFLIKDVDKKYYLSDKTVKYILRTEFNDMKFNVSLNNKIAHTLVSTMHKMHRASIDNYIKYNDKARRLTPRECLRLMGFPDNFNQVVSDTQMYKQVGNSIVVDVIEDIFKEIIATGVFNK